MPRYRVAVLSNRSLFARGTAARLRQLPEHFEIIEMDPKDPELLDKIAHLEPTAVIMDAEDAELAQRVPLSKVLSTLPRLTIVRLDPKNDQIQVVTSEQRRAGSMEDLVQTLGRAAKGM
jgi:DNA-binding NarL/FixJ family response regulator